MKRKKRSHQSLKTCLLKKFLNVQFTRKFEHPIRCIDWKDKSKGSSAGVIAQNVEEVLPSAVKDFKSIDGDEVHKHVDYNQLSALFIEAIKELKEENKLLRAEIESLKDINS